MKIIVNVVVKQDDKILMVQENWGNVKGMWNFPAGHLEENENIFDGAIREAKEETGFDVKLTGLVGVQNSIYNDRHVVHFNFSAEIIGGKVAFDTNEIAKVEFIEAEKLLSMTDDELRGGDSRRETIKRVMSGNVMSLEAVTNFDFRK